MAATSFFGGEFFGGEFFNGGTPVVVVDEVTASGVRRSIKLSDYADANARRRAAEYIKQQLALDEARADKLPEVAKPTKFKAGRKTKAQRLAEEAMRGMEREREDEARALLDNNNRIIALILMASQ